MKVLSELEIKPDKKPGRSRRLRSSDNDRKERLEKLKAVSGQRLPTYATSHLDARSVSGSVENFIGTISFPIGVAGPLKINFIETPDDLNQWIEVRAPLATTEGALVSSVQRGALAINRSGGVKARVLSNKMIRAPQFEFNSLDAAIAFSQWILKQEDPLQNLVQNRSQYAKLIGLSSHCFGRTVHVRFIYTTGNAAGQNMTTFCTSYLCQWILKEFKREFTSTTLHSKVFASASTSILPSISTSTLSPTRASESTATPSSSSSSSSSSSPADYECIDYIIEGNLSSDKKSSYLSAYEGRGRSVIAETIIKKSVLNRVLKMNVEELVARFQRSKSARVFSGQVGFNINVSNMVAALFLATGQDAACIHESSIAELHLEPRGDDLYASLYLPCLVVGTVGGGTHLPSFRDNLALLGCLQDSNSADRLAQTIGAFALALEISTVCAVAGGQFVDAHENGARKASLPGLKTSELNEEFFKKSLHNQHILKVQEIKVENKQGYITDIASQVSKKKTGVFAYQIESRNESNHLITKNAFLKLKAHEREVVLGSAKIIQALNPGLAEVILQKREFLPFKESHIREIEILSNEKKIIPKIAPRFLGSFIDQEKEAYILIQELIDASFTVSEVQDLTLWTDEIKLKTIENMSLLHREYFQQKEKAFAVSSHLIAYSSLERIDEQLELWDSLFTLSYSKLKLHYPNLFQLYDESLQNFEDLIQEMSLQPHSLIHFDLNPRNIAFQQKTKQVLFFDFEFAAWGLPQRDLSEFLLFTSKQSEVLQDFQKWSEVQYNLLKPISVTQQEWNRQLRHVTQEFVVRRLPFYYILSEFSFCNYIDQLLENLETLAQEWKRANP